MKNNKYELPTFWWVNPWAHARYLIGAAEELAGRYLETCEKLDRTTGQLAQELVDHAETKAKLDRLEQQYDIIEGQLCEAEDNVNGRQYGELIRDTVRKACAEGLTIDEACKKYKLNKGSVRTVASMLGVSFKWSGKGRKPKNRRG